MRKTELGCNRPAVFACHQWRLGEHFILSIHLSFFLMQRYQKRVTAQYEEYSTFIATQKIVVNKSLTILFVSPSRAIQHIIYLSLYRSSYIMYLPISRYIREQCPRQENARAWGKTNVAPVDPSPSIGRPIKGDVLDQFD